jgi:hypothetical protein
MSSHATRLLSWLCQPPGMALCIPLKFLIARDQPPLIWGLSASTSLPFPPTSWHPQRWRQEGVTFHTLFS